jgi:hypothetical protein
MEEHWDDAPNKQKRFIDHIKNHVLTHVSELPRDSRLGLKAMVDCWGSCKPESLAIILHDLLWRVRPNLECQELPAIMSVMAPKTVEVVNSLDPDMRALLYAYLLFWIDAGEWLKSKEGDI